jgi:serine/threonine-protein kinase
LYLKGRHFWSKRGSGLRKGLECFDAALAKDPDFALAHAGVADAHTLLGFYGYARPREAMPKARAAVERALALDPSLGEAHCALGFIHMCYDWNLPAAEREFEQVMTLKPSYVPSHYWYASCAVARGEPHTAVTRDERAVKLEPLSVFANTHLGWMLLAAARVAEAAQRLEYALELDPHFLMAHWLLGQTRLAQRRTDEGLAELQSAIELSNGLPWMTATKGVALADAGRIDAARDILAELKERASREYVRALLFGLLYGSLDERDEAFFWLEKAVEERDPQVPFALVAFPIPGMILHPKVRADPRFAALMQQHGLVM